MRNIRGIRDGDELAEFETRLTFLRGLQLASDPLVGEYDLAHLQAFHRYLFAGLYEWAGELRTVVLAKTDLFCLPEHIASHGAEIFDKLAEEDRLRGLGRESFIDRLATADTLSVRRPRRAPRLPAGEARPPAPPAGRGCRPP